MEVNKPKATSSKTKMQYSTFDEVRKVTAAASEEGQVKESVAAWLVGAMDFSSSY